MYSAVLRGRALVVSSTFDLYLGNTTDAVINMGPCELGGFNVGQYVEKLVEGHVAALNKRCD